MSRKVDGFIYLLAEVLMSTIKRVRLIFNDSFLVVQKKQLQLLVR